MLFQKYRKYFFPVFYILAMALVVLFAWNLQSSHRRSGGSPLYRNLIESQAYIKRGFSIEDTLKRPWDEDGNSGWYRYETVSKNVMYSPLPDLPKRPFLSPWGRETEEFTIVIPVTLDEESVFFLEGNRSVIPGINFAAIGENWEIYFNGTIVQSQMHTDRDLNGKIKISKNRSWRNVYFPVDRSLVVPGENILVLRIIGDPGYVGTGLSYRTHHYFDDYRIIEMRQNNFTFIVLCSIFGFTGIYYLILYLFIKNKQEIFNLYFSIFSVLLCIYTFTRHSFVNILIPNADISIRLEYTSMMLLIPVFYLFIETLVRGKVSRASIIYLYYCLFLTVTQIIFCNQYGEDVVNIWNVTVIIYSTYFLFYKLIYFYFNDKEGSQNRIKSGFYYYSIINALVGMASLYICGIYEILEVMLFRNDFSFFQYSIFTVHLAMVFSLAQRFSGMYKTMEQTNIILQQKLSALENFNIGSLHFDLVSNRAFYKDKDLLLAPKEFSVLYLLARNEGSIVNTKYLYETVWRLEYTNKDNSTLRVHIKEIRKKLYDVTDEILIESIRSEGYWLKKT